jgi:acyl carrier protein
MEFNQSTELTGQVQTLLAEVFQVPLDEVTPELAFGDLPQWDSLGHMEMMLRLEEQFGLTVDTDLIAELANVPAICTYLKEQGYARSSD